MSTSAALIGFISNLGNIKEKFLLTVRAIPAIEQSKVVSQAFQYKQCSNDPP